MSPEVPHKNYELIKNMSEETFFAEKEILDIFRNI